jgi:hypothetical protein
VKHSIFGTGKKTKKVMPKELYEIYKLIPTTNKTVGHEVPGESFEEQAIPVPKELKETYIPWADYNFYGVGS